MLSRLRSYRPSHAVIVAYLALFVALGGSSYAAIKVTGKNVKDSSLTGRDIRNSSLGTADVKNGSLLAADFAAGQLPAGAPGPRGLTGPAGPSGPAGQRGAAAATNVTVRSATDTEDAVAICLEGERAVGGGGEAVGGNDVLDLSRPNPVAGTPAAWTARAADVAGGAIGLVTAYVVCASP